MGSLQSNTKKKQKRFSSGKKKRHILKTQLVVNKKTTEIICTSYKNGKCHDYRLFKELGIKIPSKVKIAVDIGYQGLQKVHLQTVLPKKKSKKCALSNKDKKNNRALAKERVIVENKD